MLRHTPCTRRTGWALSHRTQWRGYASTPDPDNPPWFRQLRVQLLQRDVTHLPEHMTVPYEYKLSQTLTGALPPEYCYSPGLRRPIVPFGHHLIWFNPSPPTCDLLSDGTDASHSPGGAWVRRMWAGGSVQVKPDVYFDKQRGFTVDTPMAGIEHIKHVELRGQDDAAKIFVTIERRFARVDTLQESYKARHGTLGRASGLRRIQAHFENQLRSDDAWGSAILKEERNLVFFKERSPTELDAIKAGQTTSVKYLNPPGTPLFSHTLTPNRALLFRFSALTFNAHLIHLDLDYARNVEGHRNLLVHGPLSLTLMLQVMSNHLETHTKGKQVIESIEYRNLAPLYCDEDMRICGMEKRTLENGSVYDVWIEGPTGGVAVKGTVHTTSRKSTPIAASTDVSAGTPKLKEASKRYRERASGMRAKTLSGDDKKQPASRKNNPTPKQITFTKPQDRADPATTMAASATAASVPSAQPEGEKSTRPSFNENTSQSSSREVTASLIRTPGRVHRRNRPTRTKSYRFIVPPTQDAPPIRVVYPVIPAKPVLSPRTKQILRRLLRKTPPVILKKPLPLARKYAASPYVPDPAQTALRHSRFLREGVRKIEKPRIRYEGESLARWRARRRTEYYSPY